MLTKATGHNETVILSMLKFRISNLRIQLASIPLRLLDTVSALSSSQLIQPLQRLIVPVHRRHTRTLPTRPEATVPVYLGGDIIQKDEERVGTGDDR